MGCLSVRGKYIYRNGRKFFARGVSYGPFAPNSRGESYPEPERVAGDFALMRELGANLVRTYVIPPDWMFELAAKHELLLMPGISWPQHLTFLDSPEMVRDIRTTVRREMTALRQFQATVFAYSIGNEIRSDIVRWHGPRAVSRFLAELYDIGKQLDPGGLFTYSNYPSSEYLDLSFLDVISFNVYLHHEPDFRRYLTHLMSTSGDRPLVLSETGVDTIREGENQADLLSWQARAALELGLSGIVIFAFTDEWFRGGGEITDWAFGITTRQRSRKPSFAAISQIFHGSLPPPLNPAPQASVIVPTYNSAATIARCIESLKQLTYPDYEIIVVDDGSTDSSAAIAEAASVQTLRLPHQGLAAARNAGLAAARGRVVAFIDADAEADCDWLYHLAEAIMRRNAAAAGGQNFPPEKATTLASVIALAPGQAQEVRSGDQDLAQLCGCNMAIDKVALGPGQLFDCAFTQAGDDVDVSWRLRDMRKTLAYAPGAVVLHHRRTSIGAYLKQQRGYGHAEGLLFRKYPHRRDRAYVEPRWLTEWFGAGARIYYGAFGRGLFQTAYLRSPLPLAVQLPLTFEWITTAALLALTGVFGRSFWVVGAAGLSVTFACAAAGAAQSAAKLPNSGSIVILIGLWVLGPLVRSWERNLVKWSFSPDSAGQVTAAAKKMSGTIPLSERSSEASARNQVQTWDADFQLMTDVLHLALVRRGLAVAKGTSYDSFDLRIIVAPFIRVAVLVLNSGKRVSIGWRIGADWWRIGASLAILVVILMAAGFSLTSVLATSALIAATIAGLALWRAWRVPAVVEAASAELTSRIDGSSSAGQPGTPLPGVPVEAAS
jgi:O-antigen biosynthesis protein